MKTITLTVRWGEETNPAFALATAVTRVVKALTGGKLSGHEFLPNGILMTWNFVDAAHGRKT